MEGLAVTGFVFGLMGFALGVGGLVAFIRLEKLIETLKQQGVLKEDYKDE